MLSIHRLTAGDGYAYLLKHIAAGDVDRRMATPLTAYYTAAGYPVGRWLGSGLVGLGQSQLHVGSEVTEDHMAALFGRAEDPLSGRALGRPYAAERSPTERIAERLRALDPALVGPERADAIEQIQRAEAHRRTKHPVAGYDLTFSPVKSVSALWATADTGTQEQIVAAHHDAINDVVQLIEHQAAFTRTGHGGIAQIDTRGLIAAAFDHWDTRSGDPQLHTHVVVANRVQGPDRQWRTLDGRVLYAATVAMSEIHNVLLADHLTARLGITWDLRHRGERRNPAFEISGIPDELIREFSARTEQIEANLAILLGSRAAASSPTRQEMYILRQQATLMNRPAKHGPQPLADLINRWRTRAEQATRQQAQSILDAALDQSPDRPLTLADLSPETIKAYGTTTVLALQTKRSTWTRWNLLAEAARQTRLLRLATTSDRLNLLDAIVATAEDQSINLTAPATFTSPARRADGQSVFTIHNGEIFTSPVILGAEALLLDLARTTSGPTTPLDDRTKADLSHDKAEAIERITGSGQVVEALIGPAGTGKTTLLAALHRAWSTAHGAGSVVALAPSSSAASVLSDAIGIPADNVAKWIHESVGLAADQRCNWIVELGTAARLAATEGRRRRHQCIITELARARAEQDRWTLRRNQLVIVDEASMTGTMELATLAREADKAGAKLLLVGDDAQLSAADTSGAFRLIAQDTHAAELTDVWRFTHPWERQATLQLRQGDKAVIDTYDSHGRLIHGPSDQMETAAYRAWLHDTQQGRTSLLIAADNTTVTRLNARARLDRIQTGEVEPDGVPLHDGNNAGQGDRIVTRLNNRRLRLAPHRYVQNGHHWTVIRRWPDGSLTVQNDHHDTITLPAAYVRESVELAYATTAHRAQGTTVDTAHLLITDQLTRALTYVGMTRGRHTNHAYIATHTTTPDQHEPHYPQTMQDVLETVLTNDGIEKSAHETLRDNLTTATRLDHLVPLHEHLCQLDARDRYRPAIKASGLDPIDQTAVQTSPAYGPLIATLRHAEHLDLDVATTLRQAVTQSSLTNANDPAAVLHSRIERIIARTEQRTRRTPRRLLGLCLPAAHVTNPTYAAALHEIEQQILRRADWLAEQAEQTHEPWHSALRHLTRDLNPAESHTRLLQVAAYRERYAVHGPNILGSDDTRDLAQLKATERLTALIGAAHDQHHPDPDNSGLHS